MSARGLFVPGEYASMPKSLLAELTKTVSPAAKVVYLGLASYVNTSTTQAWPGPADLRKKTGLSRRAIQQGIDKLVAAGWICKASRGAPGGTNLYTLYTRRTDCASAHNAPPLAHEMPQGSAKGAPKVLKGSTQGKYSSKARRKATPPDPRAKKVENLPIPSVLDCPTFREIWARWIEYRKEIRHVLTVSTAEAQLQKLAKAGAEVAGKMIEQSVEQGWQGLFPLKDQSRNTQAKERTPRDYSQGF